MTLSLYDASILSYLQILDAMSGILDKALTHFRDNGIDPEEMVATRLHPDMLPFGFQVQSLCFHSLGAIEAVLAGELNMRERKPPLDYAALQALVAGTREALRKISPEAVNAREGAAVVFNAPGRQMPFTSEGFLMSFSLPNFYFHATTTYAILRSKGVPLGKLDFVGKLRLATKSAAAPTPCLEPRPGSSRLRALLGTAERLISLLDEAGIRRAVVLSEAFWFDSPLLTVEDRHAKVRAENDWTATEVAKYPARLIAFCSFNPLADYAVTELDRSRAARPHRVRARRAQSVARSQGRDLERARASIIVCMHVPITETSWP